MRLRRAVSLAVDRAALLRLVADGQGEVQHGPLSRSVRGYWPGVEQIGGRFDPQEARRLLAQAGYGPQRRLTVDLLTGASLTKVAEVLREQLAAVDVDVTIDVRDGATAGERLRTGEFGMALVSLLHPEADLLHLVYHSTKGSLPVARLTDPALDAELDRSRSATDPLARQAALDAAQARITEQAYVLPLYAPTVHTAVRERVRGVVLGSGGELLLDDAAVG